MRALLQANGQVEAAASEVIANPYAGGTSGYGTALQAEKVALDAVSHDLGIPSNFTVTTPTAA